MADNKERLIDKDLDEEEEESSPSLLNSPGFWLALKASFGTAILSAITITFIMLFMEVGETQEKLEAINEQFAEFESRQKILTKGVKSLNTITQGLTREVRSLDVGAAKGDLREALTILNNISENQDKQLAVSRNGLISLSRMIKGSRVWQDDYRAQFQELFQHNQQVKDEIKELRGLANPKKEETRYIELDF